MYLYVKDSHEPKYQYLIDKRQKVDQKYVDDPSAFIEYNSDINSIYQDFDQYNPDKTRKIVIVFDNMIAKKTLPSQVTELSIRCCNMNIYLAFLRQSYFKIPKDIQINCTHYCLMKIGNRTEIRAISDRHTKDVMYNDFLNNYNGCTRQSYSFMTINDTLAAKDPET